MLVFAKYGELLRDLVQGVKMLLKAMFICLVLRKVNKYFLLL